MDNIVESTRGGKVFGIEITPEFEVAHKEWLKVTRKFSKWIKREIRLKNLGEVKNRKNGKEYLSGIKACSTKIPYKNEKITVARLKDIACQNLSIDFDGKQSLLRDALNYILERYDGVGRRHDNLMETKSPITFDENASYYLKENFAKIDWKNKTITIKTLIGDLTMTFHNAFQKENLMQKGDGENYAGNIKFYKRNGKQYGEFVISYKQKVPMQYDAENILSFDLNCSEEDFLVFNNGHIEAMPEGMIDDLKKIKEYNDLINSENIRSRERRSIRHKIEKIKNVLDAKLSVVNDRIIEMAKNNKCCIAIDGVVGIGKHKGEWGQEFLTLGLAKKCENKGIPFYIIPTVNTSRRCSSCGYVDKKNREETEKFECLNCKYSSNAHLNAAENIAWIGKTFLNKGIPFGRDSKKISWDKILDMATN